MNTTADTDMLRAAEEGNAMLERIEALQPMLLANAELARSERRVPQENIEVVESLFSSAGGSSVFLGQKSDQTTQGELLPRR